MENIEHNLNEIPSRMYDKYIPDIARLRKTNDRIFVTIDEDYNYISHRIEPFLEYGKKLPPEPIIEKYIKVSTPPAKKTKTPAPERVKRFNHLSDYEKEAIELKFMTGASFQSIANALNMQHNKVRSYVYAKLNGVVKPEISERTKQEIISLMRKKYTLARIAKELELSWDVVRECMIDNPITKKHPVKPTINSLGLTQEEKIAIIKMRQSGAYSPKTATKLQLKLDVVKAFLNGSR